jgi:hypothetical protein
LACKTDRVDARVLADLVRCDLVPTVAHVRRELPADDTAAEDEGIWCDAAEGVPRGVTKTATF